MMTRSQLVVYLLRIVLSDRGSQWNRGGVPVCDYSKIVRLCAILSHPPETSPHDNNHDMRRYNYDQFLQ